MNSASADRRPVNRLAHETSPYLQQHAHNPVEWYAWGPEAFAAAREQNKPIFLSVGYSTCYWCHVMERQSFENEAIAAEMNRRLICIKVDREERPDVDQLYMGAVQMLTGQGGWPMSVFLTPDLRPFYGGTYFPPADMHGRVGFPRLIAAIDDAWQNRRAELEQSADQLVAALRRMAMPRESGSRESGGQGRAIDLPYINEMLERSTSDYDPADGGFGSAPKFPRETLLELILTAHKSLPDLPRMSQLLYTLDAMKAGGMRDHLGGAFHRYSTDAQWLVPHFEIMLYDNAMLTWVYAEAFAQTGRREYAAVARGIVDFILLEMTDPSGAFYTAIDAEVDAKEGESYLWTPEEIDDVLGKNGELFNEIYGLELGPNFADPHHGGGAPDKNILFLPKAINEEMDAKMAPLRRKLYERRRQRKQPMLDTKILTGWNALMLRGLAHAGRVLNEPRYLTAARKAADFLLTAHRSVDGGLHRVSRDGRAKGEGFLDDYAFMAQALLSLDRKEEAEQIVRQMCERFEDTEGGGFYFTAADASDLIVRQKTGSDSPLPSGNAVAARVCLALGREDLARATISAFAAQIDAAGEGMSAMILAALEAIQSGGPVVPGAVSSAGPAGPSGPVRLSGRRIKTDILEITVSIAAGFHINASEAGAGLTPTRLSVGGDEAAWVAGIEYPAAGMFNAEFADQPIPIYDGEVKIMVRFNQPLETRPVTIYLQCQACDERACLAAQTLKWVV